MRNQQAFQRAQEQKEIRWTTHKIKSLEDFENLTFDLPHAEGRPVYVLNRALSVDTKKIKAEDIGPVNVNDLILDKSRKAIVNTRTNLNAQVASASYQILDHSDYFPAVIDMLRQRGMTDVQGYAVVSHDGNRVKVRLIIKGKSIDEANMPGNIRFGAEFGNSYDSAYAATLKCFFLRMSCLNQFVVRNIIPEASFSHAHSANNRLALLEGVTIDLENAMRTLDEAGLTFKGYMERAMKSEVIIESPEQIKLLMKGIFKTETHAEAIADIALKSARPYTRDPRYHVLTQWDLVNAATFYSSHSEDITPQTQDSIFYRTETRLLKPAGIELPPVPAVSA